jgi:DNA-directed RNA polymerase subunit beta
MISLGTGLIPFLEHDDANRALMGSNMQRQALPLEKRETSIIETGTEKKIAKSSQLTKIAKKGGIIKFISCNKIIQKEIWKEWKHKSNYSILTKCKKIISSKKLKINFKYKKVKYFLTNNRKSNQNNCINQTLTIKNNEWVKKGQAIVDGLGIKNGKLSLGKNILVGYMSWEGYNFEDAIVINKRLVDEDIFTSIQMKKYKIFIINNKKDEVRIYN